jgi:hypothetical protein
LRSSAYSALAPAVVVPEGPDDWPPDWVWPPDGSNPPPPGFELDAGQFALVSPANGALNVSKTASLNWAFSLPGYSFDIILNDIMDGSSGVGVTTYSPTLVDARNYTWRAIARQGSKHIVGPEWSFKTKGLLAGTATVLFRPTGALKKKFKLAGSSALAMLTADAALTRLQPPAAPSGLTAAWGADAGGGTRYFNLAWTDNSSDETGFVIDWAYGLPWGNCGTPPGTGSWEDSGTIANWAFGAGVTSDSTHSGFTAQCFHFRICSYKTISVGNLYSAWTDWTVLHKYAGH